MTTRPHIMPLKAVPESVRDAIALGVTRMRCPVCDGGSTRELSLSIKPANLAEGVAMFSLHCFRAGCGWHAFVPDGDDATRVDTRHVRPAKRFELSTKRLSKTTKAFLGSNYLIHARVVKELCWRELADPVDGVPTLVIHVAGPSGETRGHITRTLPQDGGAKRVYTYKQTAQPFLCWTPKREWRPPTTSIVVVEDALSAVRVHQANQGPSNQHSAPRGVALLGTHLSHDGAREIAAVARGVPIFLALDRDAFDKAVKMAEKYRGLGDFRAVCLDKDLKDIRKPSPLVGSPGHLIAKWEKDAGAIPSG